jgi:hypothetical protein
MKFQSISDDKWLYQKEGNKYYDCGMRAIMNAYMFWNGYSEAFVKKLGYYRNKYGPYVDGRIGEMEVGEIFHFSHEMGLSIMPIIPTETGMNGVLRYNLPILCTSSNIIIERTGYEGKVVQNHAFCIFPGWKGINVNNKPVHKLQFSDLILPTYDYGKQTWDVIHTIIPKEYSLKYLQSKVSVDSSSLFRIISETIYSDERYR